MRTIASAGLALSLLFLAACGSDEVHYGIKMPLRSDFSGSEDIRRLSDRINSGNDVNFSEITVLLIRSQNEYYPSFQLSELEAVLSKVRGELSRDKGPGETKKLYEEKFERELGKEIVYNVDAKSIFHFAKEGKLQCASGTMMNQVLMRQLYGAKDFRESKWVVIHEKGHVLPGYMVQSNGGWELVGLESTVAGMAKVNYGAASALGKDIRVVDAEYYALMEILKNHLEDPTETANEILDYTAQRYGLTQIYKIEPVEARLTYEINNSPFAFGSKDVAPGDRPRSKADEVRRGTRPGLEGIPMMMEVHQVELHSQDGLLNEILMLLSELKAPLAERLISGEGNFKAYQLLEFNLDSPFIVMVKAQMAGHPEAIEFLTSSHEMQFFGGGEIPAKDWADILLSDKYGNVLYGLPPDAVVSLHEQLLVLTKARKGFSRENPTVKAYWVGEEKANDR